MACSRWGRNSARLDSGLRRLCRQFGQGAARARAVRQALCPWHGAPPQNVPPAANTPLRTTNAPRAEIGNPHISGKSHIIRGAAVAERRIVVAGSSRGSIYFECAHFPFCCRVRPALCRTRLSRGSPDCTNGFLWPFIAGGVRGRMPDPDRNSAGEDVGCFLGCGRNPHAASVPSAEPSVVPQRNNSARLTRPSAPTK